MAISEEQYSKLAGLDAVVDSLDISGVSCVPAPPKRIVGDLKIDVGVFSYSNKIIKGTFKGKNGLESIYEGYKDINPNNYDKLSIFRYLPQQLFVMYVHAPDLWFTVPLSHIEVVLFRNLSKFREYRHVLWEHFDEWLESGGKDEKLQIKEVFAKVGSFEHLMQLLKRYPQGIAYLLRRSTNYKIKAKSIEEGLLGKLGDLSKISPIDAEGKVDIKLAKMQLDFYRVLKGFALSEEVAKVNLLRPQRHEHVHTTVDARGKLVKSNVPQTNELPSYVKTASGETALASATKYIKELNDTVNVISKGEKVTATGFDKKEIDKFEEEIRNKVGVYANDHVRDNDD